MGVDGLGGGIPVIALDKYDFNPNSRAAADNEAVLSGKAPITKKLADLDCDHDGKVSDTEVAFYLQADKSAKFDDWKIVHSDVGSLFDTKNLPGFKLATEQVDKYITQCGNSNTYGGGATAGDADAMRTALQKTYGKEAIPDSANIFDMTKFAKAELKSDPEKMGKCLAGLQQDCAARFKANPTNSTVAFRCMVMFSIEMTTPSIGGYKSLLAARDAADASRANHKPGFGTATGDIHIAPRPGALTALKQNEFLTTDASPGDGHHTVTPEQFAKALKDDFAPLLQKVPDAKTFIADIYKQFPAMKSKMNETQLTEIYNLMSGKGLTASDMKPTPGSKGAISKLQDFFTKLDPKLAGQIFANNGKIDNLYGPRTSNAFADLAGKLGNAIQDLYDAHIPLKEGTATISGTGSVFGREVKIVRDPVVKTTTIGG
jgi:hypothetical protein